MTDFKQNACGSAFDAYRKGQPEWEAIEKNFNMTYIKPLPEELKIVGGTAGMLYNKRLRVVIYRGLLIDIRNNQQGIGYVFSF